MAEIERVGSRWYCVPDTIVYKNWNNQNLRECAEETMIYHCGVSLPKTIVDNICQQKVDNICVDYFGALFAIQFIYMPLSMPKIKFQ